MEPPRLLFDSMLGRLARYARFVGCDAEYAPDVDDRALVARATAEHRRVVTRDRQLASRLPDSVLLRRLDLEGQWKELRRAVPSVPTELAFLRCSLCNGPLVAYRRGSDPARETAIPAALAPDDPSLHACSRCGHLYWEGSHTANIRARLRLWSTGSG